MRDGWNTYYLLILASLLSLVFPALLFLISRSMLAGVVRPKAETSGGRKVDVRPWREVHRTTNLRFFTALNAGMGLIGLSLLMVPTVSVLREISRGGEHDLVIRGVIVIFLSGGLLIAGLLYAGRKGDLDWLRTFQKGKKP